MDIAHLMPHQRQRCGMILFVAWWVVQFSIYGCSSEAAVQVLFSQIWWLFMIKLSDIHHIHILHISYIIHIIHSTSHTHTRRNAHDAYCPFLRVRSITQPPCQQERAKPQMKCQLMSHVNSHYLIFFSQILHFRACFHGTLFVSFVVFVCFVDMPRSRQHPPSQDLDSDSFCHAGHRGCTFGRRGQGQLGMTEI